MPRGTEIFLLDSRLVPGLALDALYAVVAERGWRPWGHPQLGDGCFVVGLQRHTREVGVRVARSLA